MRVPLVSMERKSSPMVRGAVRTCSTHFFIVLKKVFASFLKVWKKKIFLKVFLFQVSHVELFLLLFCTFLHDHLTDFLRPSNTKQLTLPARFSTPKTCPTYLHTPPDLPLRPNVGTFFRPQRFVWHNHKSFFRMVSLRLSGIKFPIFWATKHPIWLSRSHAAYQKVLMLRYPLFFLRLQHEPRKSKFACSWYSQYITFTSPTQQTPPSK